MTFSFRHFIAVPLLSLLAACASNPVSEYEHLSAPETVVLVHGFSKNGDSMVHIGEYLAQYGYEFVSVDYPSSEVSVEQALAMMHQQLQGCCEGSRKVHYVGHSFGGLLIRAYLADHGQADLGKVVLIATPNQGSEFVNAINRVPGHKRMFGPMLPEMSTDGDGFPSQLPGPEYPVGVIAGNRTHNPLGWLLLPGDDDGAVSVASTRLEGMDDFLVVPANHHWLRRDPRVLEEVLHFIQRGYFKTGEQAESVAKRRGDVPGGQIEG